MKRMETIQKLPRFLSVVFCQKDARQKTLNWRYCTHLSGIVADNKSDWQQCKWLFENSSAWYYLADFKAQPFGAKRAFRSSPTLWRELRRLNLRRKKSVVAERNKWKRAWHWRRMKGMRYLNCRDFDEAGATTVLTRSEPSAAKRTTESVVTEPSTSMIATMEPWRGSSNDDWRKRWHSCFQCLLREGSATDFGVGDAIVLEHCQRISKLTEEIPAKSQRKGVILLPPYSPDFHRLNWCGQSETYLK